MVSGLIVRPSCDCHVTVMCRLVFKDRMHMLLYVVFGVTFLLSIISLFYGKVHYTTKGLENL